MSRLRATSLQKLPYVIKKKLGSGSFATVYVGEHPKTRQQVALKVFKQDVTKGEIKEEIQGYHIVARLRPHPNIISFLKEYAHPTNKSLVLAFEYAEGGDLFSRLRKVGFFSEADTRDIMRDILNGLDHLHKGKIVHRDLKPANIVLRTKKFPGIVALTDFGISAPVPGGKPAVLNYAGTIAYSAPEALKHGFVGRKGDIFAVGVIMHELLLGFRPFEASRTSVENLVEAIISKKADFKDASYKNISSDSLDLMVKLVTKNPNFRPNAVETLQHPWFRTAPTTKTFSMKRSGYTMQDMKLAAIKPYIEARLEAQRRNGEQRRHKQNGESRAKRKDGRSRQTRGKRRIPSARRKTKRRVRKVDARRKKGMRK